MKKTVSLRKQLSRIITMCCIIVACVQAIVMAAMIMKQYIVHEKENTLFLLKSNNEKINEKFQYLEEIILAVQNDEYLMKYLEGEDLQVENVTKQLEGVTNLFADKNQLEGTQPFVKKIYLFNKDGKVVYNLYYPVTIAEKEYYKKKYYELYEDYKDSKNVFYFRTEDESLNLCMRLFNSQMENVGDCIIALNENAIENIHSNLESLNYFSWSICQNGEILLGKENFEVSENSYMLEHRMAIGFGLELYAAVPQMVIYRSLGNIMLTVLSVSVLIVAVLSWWGHRMAIRYVRPLETVAEKIELVGKGKFDTKLDEYQIEELQKISITFNEMTDYIEHLVKEVYETQLSAQQAKIQYLQAQMDPHFLFNVLSMIMMKAAINQDKEVQDMLYKLSGLYQGKIFRKNEYFIFLEEEMEIVDFYLSLQSSRFNQKIEYVISYEGEQDNYRNLMVPRLSIEPIVENAVRHGLEPKEEKGKIKIHISREHLVLKIKIEDNGVGFDTDKIIVEKDNNKHSHVGLWNTNRLIHNLCGNEYGLNIASTIGKGTVVMVLLPVRSEGVYVEGNDC